jgi:hypothetical protein
MTISWFTGSKSSHCNFIEVLIVSVKSLFILFPSRLKINLEWPIQISAENTFPMAMVPGGEYTRHHFSLSRWMFWRFVYDLITGLLIHRTKILKMGQRSCEESMRFWPLYIPSPLFLSLHCGLLNPNLSQGASPLFLTNGLRLRLITKGRTPRDTGEEQLTLP